MVEERDMVARDQSRRLGDHISKDKHKAEGMKGKWEEALNS